MKSRARQRRFARQQHAQEEMERRAALALLEGDELGHEPMLGLFRRALEEYAQVSQLWRYSNNLYWELRSLPWLVLLPGRAELVAPWDTSLMRGVVLRRLTEEVQQCTAAAGALFLHAQTRQYVSRGVPVLKRIEQAIVEARQNIRRKCSCGHEGFWKDFVFIGVQQDEPPLELRNCLRCNTTLAIEMR